MVEVAIIATLAAGVDFQAAAAIWAYEAGQRLTLIDVNSSPLAALDVWCQTVSARIWDAMSATGQYRVPVVRSPHANFLIQMCAPPDPLAAPAVHAWAHPDLADMATLRGLPTNPIPPEWAALHPEEIALMAATYMARGLVVLGAAVAAKCRRHPYSAIINWRAGQPRTGVVDAFALGPLLAFRRPP